MTVPLAAADHLPANTPRFVIDGLPRALGVGSPYTLRQAGLIKVHRGHESLARCASATGIAGMS